MDFTPLTVLTELCGSPDRTVTVLFEKMSVFFLASDE